MARSKKTKSPKKGDNEKKDKKDISKKVVEKKAAKKNTETDKEGHKKRRKKSDYSTYGRFLFKFVQVVWFHLIVRVLKQVHPDIGITVKAMDIMESFVQGKIDFATPKHCSRYVRKDCHDLK